MIDPVGGDDLPTTTPGNQQQQLGARVDNKAEEDPGVERTIEYVNSDGNAGKLLIIYWQYNVILNNLCSTFIILG